MEGLLISDLPADERPRERYERLGASALSLPELLAILLRTGVRGSSAMTMATRLLEKYDGSLVRMANAPIGELRRYPGLGQAKATTLGAAFELARRMMLENLPEQVDISSPETVADYLRLHIAHPDQEEFHVIMLNTRNQVLNDACITVGLMDRSLVHAREVFRNAIRTGCASVIIGHNHPSGDPRPSPEDKAITDTLVAAGELLDIRVLDHVILGRKEADPRGVGFFSFGRAGMLNDASHSKGAQRKDHRL